MAVVDATNLERNLYLVTQILEYGIPVVIALTMIDVFEKQKHEIDIEMLSVMLKTPIVAVNVKTGRGIEELSSKVDEVLFTTPSIFRISQPILMAKMPPTAASLLDTISFRTPFRNPFGTTISRITEFQRRSIRY